MKKNTKSKAKEAASQAVVDKPTEPQQNEVSFGAECRKLIRSFSRGLDVLREFHSMVSPVIAQNAQRLIAAKDGVSPALLSAFVKAAGPDKLKAAIGDSAPKGVKVSGDSKSFTISIPATNLEYLQELRNVLKEIERVDRSGILLNRGILMNLTSIFEYQISRLIQIHFKQFPETINASDKALSLNDLKTLNSVEEAVNCLVQERIDNILRESFLDWMKYLRSSLKLSMGYLEKEEDSISEVFLRRNLIVHNDGIVNARYLTRVKATTAKLGSRLEADDEYLKRSIDRIEIVGILMVAELWKKVLPEDIIRLQVLNDIAYEHLRGGRWAIAESLSIFTKGDRQGKEIDQLIGQINAWLAMKRLGRYEAIKAEIAKADFSANEQRFHFAKHGLLEEHDQIFKKLPRALKNKAITLAEIHQWPLFEELRQTSVYKSKWKNRKDPKETNKSKPS